MFENYYHHVAENLFEHFIKHLTCTLQTCSLSVYHCLHPYLQTAIISFGSNKERMRKLTAFQSNGNKTKKMEMKIYTNPILDKTVARIVEMEIALFITMKFEIGLLLQRTRPTETEDCWGSHRQVEDPYRLVWKCYHCLCSVF